MAANNVTEKIVLSGGAADGTGIKVVATATAGTLIHTGPTTVTEFDELYLYAQNNHNANVDLTIERGNANTENNVKVTIPYKQGATFVVP